MATDIVGESTFGSSFDLLLLDKGNLLFTWCGDEMS